MSGCSGKTRIVLYIDVASLLDFLECRPVRAWHQANMVRDSKDNRTIESITVMADPSCVKMEEGYKIYVTCDQIIESHVLKPIE